MRGGFTRKPHLGTDGRRRPLSLIVTPGRRADCTQFQPVLENIRVPGSGLGRPRKKPDSLVADSAYSNGPIREHPATTGDPPRHPGEDRQRGRPPAQRRTRWPPARLRRGPLREAQHRRAGDQPPEAVPGGGHSLRQAWLRLPRHRHRRGRRDLASNMNYYATQQ
ncbi:transposase [Streptomyces sp. HB132]|uniref:transposase n=1 Tax=Streptomyces sp. HB132 TaxID=767388 RepID=UPI00195FAD83